MNHENFNAMDIDHDGMIQNDEHQKNINDLNLSLQSYETEEEIKLRKIINSLVIMGGYSNIIYFIIQYVKYLNSINNPNKKDTINPLYSDDGFNEEEFFFFFLNKDAHSKTLAEREKMMKMKASGHTMPSINSIMMAKKKEKEKQMMMMKKYPFPYPPKPQVQQAQSPPHSQTHSTVSDPNDDRKLYYQKGGRVGMHYYTSNEDGNIYKYYCIQYNNDGTFGFKCTENACRSKALLDRNKNFNIIAKHTMGFKEHKKLHGSYLRDRFIKFMIQKKIKEIQLTKKNDRKVIEWYK